MPLSAFNLWAIFGAAMAAWLVGTAYYTLLAEAWAKALGTSVEHLRRERAAKAGTSEAWLPFVLAFVADLVMAWVLAGLLFHMDMQGPFAGVVIGAFVWLGLVVTTLAVNNMFAGRKPMLTLIDGGHWLLALATMGAILGLAA